MGSIIQAAATKDRAPVDRAITGSYFQTMRELNPPLRLLVNSRVRDVQWVLNHATLLTYFILMDLLSEEQLSEKALEEASRELPVDLRRSVSPRQLRRLANYHYRHMVQTVVKPSPELKRLMDDPKLIVLGPPRPTKPIAEDDERVRLMQTTYSQKTWNQSFFPSDLVDPNYLELFERYWKSVMRLLPAVRSKGFLRKDTIWVLDRFAAGDFAAHVLFQDVTDEVYRQWFESSLGSKAKADMLNPLSWPSYTPEDAGRAVECYSSLLSAFRGQRDPVLGTGGAPPEEVVLEEIALGTLSYMQRPDGAKVGVWTFDECLSQGLFKGEIADAACRHNLAVSLLIVGDFSRISSSLPPAVEVWKRRGDALRAAIDEALVALTARTTRGPDGEGQRRHEILSSLAGLPKELVVRTCLELADYASAKSDRDAERDFLSEGLKNSAPADDLREYAEYFAKRLGALGPSSIRVFQTNLDAETADLPGKCYAERRLNGTFLSFCGGFPHLHSSPARDTVRFP